MTDLEECLNPAVGHSPAQNPEDNTELHDYSTICTRDSVRSSQFLTDSLAFSARVPELKLGLLCKKVMVPNRNIYIPDRSNRNILHSCSWDDPCATAEHVGPGCSSFSGL